MCELFFALVNGCFFNCLNWKIFGCHIVTDVERLLIFTLVNVMEATKKCLVFFKSESFGMHTTQIITPLKLHVQVRVYIAQLVGHQS